MGTTPTFLLRPDSPDKSIRSFPNRARLNFPSCLFTLMSFSHLTLMEMLLTERPVLVFLARFVSCFCGVTYFFDSLRGLHATEHIQAGETFDDVASRGSESPASADKHFKGAWKDEWVTSLIHLRGSMDDEFSKPQRSGLDLWTRICTGMSEAHNDFDKNNESCRKKWQRLFKMFKDAKTASGTSTDDKQLPSKWFDLIQHYMHHHFDANGNAIGSDELSLQDGVAHMDTSVENDVIIHCIQSNAKRARRDQVIKETLSKMVITWRKSLEVLKESEAKRLDVLQKMSSTMAELLDTLKK